MPSILNTNNLNVCSVPKRKYQPFRLLKSPPPQNPKIRAVSTDTSSCSVSTDGSGSLIKDTARECVFWSQYEAESGKGCDEVIELNSNVLVKSHDTKNIMEYKVLKVHEMLWDDISKSVSSCCGKKLVTVVRPVRGSEELGYEHSISRRSEFHKTKGFSQNLHRSQAINDLGSVCDGNVSRENISPLLPARKDTIHQGKDTRGRSSAEGWGYFVVPKFEDNQFCRRRKLF